MYDHAQLVSTPLLRAEHLLEGKGVGGSKWEMLQSQRTMVRLWYGSGLPPKLFPWSTAMAGAEGYEGEMLEEDLCSSR